MKTLFRNIPYYASFLYFICMIWWIFAGVISITDFIYKQELHMQFWSEYVLAISIMGMTVMFQIVKDFKQISAQYAEYGESFAREKCGEHLKQNGLAIFILAITWHVLILVWGIVSLVVFSQWITKKTHHTRMQVSQNIVNILYSISQKIKL